MARVLRTSVAAPSPSPGGATLPERSLPLTHMDAMWLHTSPVERVFLFHHAHEHEDDSDSGTLLSNLQDSLSEALRSFYPLAGRLRLIPGTSNRHELHYQPGGGVSFTVAEYAHADVDELATDEPTELARIAPLVPRLPEGGAALALQATLLRRGGLAVGVTVHHAACDGACSTHFLHTWAWAAASRGATIAPEPHVIGRTFIRDRDDLYDAFAAPRPYRDRVGKLLRSPDAVVDKLLATFVLSEDLLRSIKDTVAPEAAYGDGVLLTLAGSPRFRVYDMDFGFGRPTKVDIVSVARTGAMSVAEGRGGAGGTEVGISLPPDGIRRFRRCFADAVACLSSTSP